MKRSAMKPRRANLRPRKPIAKKRRQPAAFARIYGSKARVQWVKAHGCLACARVPSENAHTPHPSAGAGRKADYCAIVPLCAEHHRELHRLGVASFQTKHEAMLSGRSLVEWAARLQDAWLYAEAEL